MTKEKLDMLIALNMNFIIDFENIKNIAKEKNIINFFSTSFFYEE